jgi:hypothetical protein
MVASVDPLEFLSAHSLLNIESAIALLFLAGVLARASQNSQPANFREPSLVWIYLSLSLVVAIAYWRVLGEGFLFDDYTHITDARNATFASILADFGPVEHPPGLFFRPFGFLIYWLNYLIAGPHPLLWHAASLVFHAVNACLLYALARALHLSWIGSFGAAVLFAVTGAGVEPAAWIDARFDPMATGLVLASLLCVCRFLDQGRSTWLISAALFALAAFTSKESAFCLPLLIACLWFFRPEDRKRLSAAFACIGLLAVAVFAYRWWALGGIGGYRSAAGESNLASFSPVRMLNAVLVRDWTILFFPINWSTPVVLAVCAWKSKVPGLAAAGAIAMTICAALPVQHLLLIGIDLANTRFVYLLSVGWALLWGLVFAGLPTPRWRFGAIGAMAALHVLIGQHNLGFWLDVHEEVTQVCTAFAQTISSTPGTAIAGGLPMKKNGVVFLANGFPECVAMNSNLPASKVSVFGTPNYVWNPATNRLEPVAAVNK